MNERFWDGLLAVIIIFAIVGSFVCGWFARDYTISVADPERLWEGSAEWVSVNAIESENITLKHLLSDQQAHYDTLVCFRPGESNR